MISKTDKSIKESSPYTAVITREQFLFSEMRITAGLLSEKLSDEEIKKRIYDENMFQYPTEKSVNRMVDTCLKRLRTLDDSEPAEAVAKQPSDISKQICLYAMMK